MKTHRIIRALGALTMAAGFAACMDSLSLEGTGEARVLVQRASDAATFPAPQSESGTRAMSPDTVQSLTVGVTAIQFLHAGADSGWSTLQFGAPVQVDLMALSTNRDSALVLAMGRVEAGSYSRARLVVNNPRIRLRGAVSFGASGILQGNTDYAVQLGAPGATAIEINAVFSVSASASGSGSGGTSDLRLVFDAGSSLATVSLLGSGSLVITPVWYQN